MINASALPPGTGGAEGTSGGSGHGRGFASDNYAGIHPAALQAIAEANDGHEVSYGADAHTARLQEVMRRHFGAQAEAFPVFNGTGANVVSLQAMTRRWDAVVCSEQAHVNVDECGAPEKIAGLKLLSVPTSSGKLTPAAVRARVTGVGDEHRAQPRVLTLTESTELGTCYTADELGALCDSAHGLGLGVHLDGARLANAAAHLGCELIDLTTAAGVDVLSLGGTKNGLMLGDAIVVLEPRAVEGLRYLRKAAMQLASKMRFVSAQIVALFEGDLWLENARHSNAMAARLARGVAGMAGVTVTQEVEANALFAILAPGVAEKLQERFAFYTWDEGTGEVRWMTSFDTTEADVDGFVAAITAAVAGGAAGSPGTAS